MRTLSDVRAHRIDAPALPLPYFSSAVSAGFPSPADDYLDADLDLNTLLVAHPAATYYLRVEGASMIGAGIHNGDIVIAVLDGELTIKRLHTAKGVITLVPENSAFQPITITSHQDFIIWGVVTGCVRQFKR
jgi:DNA polymerase V